ncbi:MAG: hypothetical protein H0U23_16700 [Blastocatellia bacterium]|nr:hypothetical protein [Blastocatellia bacterium]
MMATLRSLNGEGVSRFRAWLEEARAGKKRPKAPDGLLYDDRFSARVSTDVQLPPEQFSSAWAAAEALSTALATVPAEELESSSGLGSVGIWSWLALFYFDQLSPGVPLAAHRYIPETEGAEAGLRYYRHLLAGPLRLYRQLGKLAAPALSTPLTGHNVLYRAFADYQDFVQNPGIVEAMNLLYYDSTTGRLRRGIANAERPGSLSRFFPVMQQLEVNYDLLGMTADKILELLPPEFDDWIGRIDTAEPGEATREDTTDVGVAENLPGDENAEGKPVSRQQHWAQQQKAAGLCQICGKPKVNASFCEFHAQKAREYRRASYERSKLNADPERHEQYDGQD